MQQSEPWILTDIHWRMDNGARHRALRGRVTWPKSKTLSARFVQPPDCQTHRCSNNKACPVLSILCCSFVHRLLICSSILADRLSDVHNSQGESSNTPANEDCTKFLLTLALIKKSDATAALTGVLRKHLHSQTHLNDHSTQWENFNGALEGRKEGSCQLANFRHSASQMKHWKWQRGGVERRERFLSLTFDFLHHVSLTIITPCIRYERVSELFDSLNHFSLSSCFLALSFPPSLPSFLCLILPFSNSPFHSHLPPLLPVPE